MATPPREERHGTQETRQESLAKTDEKHCSVRFGLRPGRKPSAERKDSFSTFVRGLTPTAKTNAARRARVFAA